jgi:thiol:disulfide interchange protein DsbC
MLAIFKTEMTGLYSANLDNQIIYLDENAQHMFIGSMVRLKDQKNLTKDLFKTKFN